MKPKCEMAMDNYGSSMDNFSMNIRVVPSNIFVFIFLILVIHNKIFLNVWISVFRAVFY